MDLEREFRSAIALRNQGRLPDAEAKCRRILSQHPDEPKTLHLLGLLAFDVARYDIAERLFAKALQQDERNLALYNARGRSLAALGRLGEAQNSWRRALALKSSNAQTAFTDLISTVRSQREFEKFPELICGQSIELRNGAKVSVPAPVVFMSTFVLIEQERWMEVEFEFIDSVLLEGESAIDIGANYGVYSLSMARTVGRNGRILAIEPNQHCIFFLKNSRKLNGLENLEIRQCAISDRSGKGFLVHPGSNSEISIVTTENEDELEGEKKPVRITTLDELTEEEGSRYIDFLKVDAEGHEAKIFAGGSSARGGITLDHVRGQGREKYRLVWCTDSKGSGLLYLSLSAGPEMSHTAAPGRRF